MPGPDSNKTPAEESATRRAPSRIVVLDRSLESLPLFRLSDSSDAGPVVHVPESGGRWRVLPAPGDRLPGTFDQDVYVEVCRRFHECGAPAHGSVTFTLHALLRSIGRRADGRTYEQLRGALVRLERTTLESLDAYWSAASGAAVTARFTLFSSVSIDRRRQADKDQLSLFATLSTAEPGEARVILSPTLRANIAAGHSSMILSSQYFALSSPVARRLYRMIEVSRSEGSVAWRVSLEKLAERVPLAQRYPSHLVRVLQPAHEMLLSAGILRSADIRQQRRTWMVDYVLAGRPR
ncbi:MAG TPA: replication initiator protein A [Gemmatimonadaceae bacterium]